jgi:hypothetical protein
MGKLAKIKTQATDASVNDFIQSLKSEQRIQDAQTLIALMEEATKTKPRMWGKAIVAFGDKRYTSPATGRQVDWFVIGFSPRKANFSLYLMGSRSALNPLLEKLGKHKTGGGCIYINKLADVDLKVLIKMIQLTVKANA